MEPVLGALCVIYYFGIAFHNLGSQQTLGYITSEHREEVPEDMGI